MNKFAGSNYAFLFDFLASVTTQKSNVLLFFSWSFCTFDFMSSCNFFISNGKRFPIIFPSLKPIFKRYFSYPKKVSLSASYINIFLFKTCCFSYSFCPNYNCILQRKALSPKSLHKNFIRSKCVPWISLQSFHRRITFAFS